MKLLFTFFKPSGGMETLNRIRCQVLRDHGIDCHMLYKFDAEGRKNIHSTPTFVMQETTQIAMLLAQQQYDAIIVCTDYLLLDFIRSTGFSGPLIYEIQGLGDAESGKELISQAHPYVHRSATSLLYPDTPHLIQLMQHTFSELPHFCFDNPLNLDRFRYEAYPVLRGPVMAWVGRIEVNKNWEEFIELGRRLLDAYPELALWMFGDADLYETQERQKFEAKIVEYKLGARLVLLSNVPHALMADYFSIIGDSGGFLCSTSLYEGFGYAVAEALLCRCPVLTTDSDGVRSFINHEETGLFYGQGDVDQAVVHASRLLGNPALRRRLRDNGEALIKKRFTPDRFAFYFLNMLKSLGLSIG